MSDAPEMKSPLIEIDSQKTQGVVSMTEKAFQSHLVFCGDPDDQRLCNSVAGVFDVTLPQKANTFTENSNVTICWQAPGEWLIISPTAPDGKNLERLEDALSGQICALNDISSGQTVFVLKGPQTRRLLQRGCTLDLHTRVFKPGHCAHTILARTRILLLNRREPADYEVIVRRSFADYLWRWLDYVNLELLAFDGK